MKLNKFIKIFKIISTVLLIILFLDFCKEKVQDELYYCPMHPDYTSDHPGTCPICNMNLVKREKKQKPEEKESNHDHSQMQNDKENSDSREPKKENNTFQISSEQQKLIGVETSRVIYKEFNKLLRFPATVAYDPELYAAIVEYREIAKQKNLEDTHEHSGILLSSAANRLKQMGLSSDAIRYWVSRDPSELLTGGRGGVSHIYAQIYEAEIGSIKKGMDVKVFSNTYPDKIFPAKIQSIDTILDPGTRTLRIRVTAIDKTSQLLPQMLAEVELNLKTQNVLSVPSNAIMHTGIRSLVYRKIGEDTFERIEIVAGKESDDYTEVAKGLKEGDEIVTKANFLVDSESKIRLGNGGHSHD